MRNQLKTILSLGVLSSLVVAVAFGATAVWVGVAAALALNIGAYFWSDRLVLGDEPIDPLGATGWRPGERTRT